MFERGHRRNIQWPLMASRFYLDCLLEPSGAIETRFKRGSRYPADKSLPRHKCRRSTVHGTNYRTVIGGKAKTSGKYRITFLGPLPWQVAEDGKTRATGLAGNLCFNSFTSLDL